MSKPLKGLRYQVATGGCRGVIQYEWDAAACLLCQGTWCCACAVAEGFLGGRGGGGDGLGCPWGPQSFAAQCLSDMLQIAP